MRRWEGRPALPPLPRPSLPLADDSAEGTASSAAKAAALAGGSAAGPPPVMKPQPFSEVAAFCAGALAAGGGATAVATSAAHHPPVGFHEQARSFGDGDRGRDRPMGDGGREESVRLAMGAGEECPHDAGCSHLTALRTVLRLYRPSPPLHLHVQAMPMAAGPRGGLVLPLRLSVADSASRGRVTHVLLLSAASEAAAALDCPQGEAEGAHYCPQSGGWGADRQAPMPRLPHPSLPLPSHRLRRRPGAQPRLPSGGGSGRLSAPPPTALPGRP